MKNKILLILLFLLHNYILAQTYMNIHHISGSIVQVPFNTIDSVTYTVGELATISTLPILNLTNNSATTGGLIENDGGSSITHRGVVWHINPNPVITNNFTIDGSGSGSYSSSVLNLTPNTTYYLRSYAINGAGIVYGNEVSFSPISSGGISTSFGEGVNYNGINYSSVVYGNGQEWMIENLRTDKYSNGDFIQNVTNEIDWINLTTGSWTYYLNDSLLDNPFGKLYNWYAVNDQRNICPINWHVPSDYEWTSLIQYLDPNANSETDNVNFVGGKMKTIGTQFWESPNLNASNESLFSGLPGGIRSSSGNFDYLGTYGYWWTSSVGLSNSSWARMLSYENGILYRFQDYKITGRSVRCIRN
jgi:uncharacterized protein (TIGR02145 family)